MNISGKLNVGLIVEEIIPLGFASQTVQSANPVAVGFTNGTGPGQCNLHWELPSVALAAGASVTYDMSALTDALGRTVAFTKVRLFVITILSRIAGDNLVLNDQTAPATNPWTSLLGLAANTLKVWDVFAVGAGQSDGLVVASGSNAKVLIKNTGANSILFSISAVGLS